MVGVNEPFFFQGMMVITRHGVEVGVVMPFDADIAAPAAGRFSDGVTPAQERACD